MEENQERERLWFYLGGWLLLGLAAVLGLLRSVTGLTVQGLLLPCLFHAATGGYCPGCGGTRAAALLLEGRLAASLVCHPLVLYGAVLFCWFMGGTTLWLLSRQRLGKNMRGRKWQLWLAIGLTAGNFLWKNIGWFCFGIRLEDWLGMLVLRS